MVTSFTKPTSHQGKTQPIRRHSFLSFIPFLSNWHLVTISEAEFIARLCTKSLRSSKDTPVASVHQAQAKGADVVVTGKWQRPFLLQASGAHRGASARRQVLEERIRTGCSWYLTAPLLLTHWMAEKNLTHSSSNVSS